MLSLTCDFIWYEIHTIFSVDTSGTDKYMQAYDNLIQNKYFEKDCVTLKFIFRSHPTTTLLHNQK